MTIGLSSILSSFLYSKWKKQLFSLYSQRAFTTQNMCGLGTHPIIYNIWIKIQQCKHFSLSFDFTTKISTAPNAYKLSIELNSVKLLILLISWFKICWRISIGFQKRCHYLGGKFAAERKKFTIVHLLLITPNHFWEIKTRVVSGW